MLPLGILNASTTRRRVAAVRTSVTRTRRQMKADAVPELSVPADAGPFERRRGNENHAERMPRLAARNASSRRSMSTGVTDGPRYQPYQ